MWETPFLVCYLSHCLERISDFRTCIGDRVILQFWLFKPSFFNGLTSSCKLKFSQVVLDTLNIMNPNTSLNKRCFI